MSPAPDPAPVPPRTTARDVTAAVLLLAWLAAPVTAIYGGVSSTSFNGETVPEGQYALGQALLWVGCLVGLLGPALVCWLTSRRLMRGAAVVEMILTVVLLLALFS